MMSLRYFIDEKGFLWRGPRELHDDETMRYSRFDGIGDSSTDFYEIWTLRLSAEPYNADEITRRSAFQFVVAQRIVSKIEERWPNLFVEGWEPEVSLLLIRIILGTYCHDVRNSD